MKVSRSSDIRLSSGGVEGSEEACRSPTDKCEKSLDIESMINRLRPRDMFHSLCDVTGI